MKTFIYVPSVSSLLLLRNPPNTFAFTPLPTMSLSSRNRSNSKAFRPIMPYSAPVCEGMHYHKTGVPWQMNSTRMLIKSPFKKRYPAAICSVFRGVNFSLCIGPFCIENAKLSKILQDVYSKSSRNGVKSRDAYYYFDFSISSISL